jgi:spermidine synthase
MPAMRKYILEIIVFFSGAIVMILELAGSRVMAPYVGTSILVWTSLIGIILGSLSLGYYLGGRIADKKASFRILAFILFSAAILIAFTTLVKDPILTLITTSIRDLRTSSVVAAIILFTPASIALGMVSPYAVKLKLHELSETGRTVGNLSAISTIGSIVGTFLAGFFLITYLGNTNLLFLLSALLLLTSILAANSVKLRAFITAALVIGIVGFVMQQGQDAEAIELDTTYSHVQIYDDEYSTGPVRILKLNNNYHSAMHTESDELVFEYTKYYRMVDHFMPELENALMIGGGAYSYPKDFLANHKNATLDVVEIDGQLTELAKEYFNLEDNPNLSIFHEDGRIYLNNNEKTYDAIFQDAFSSSLAIPYHLTTVEHVQNMYDALSEDGVALINVISRMEGEGGKFIQAQYHTYKEVFPYVYLFPVQFPGGEDIAQNIMLVATKSEKTLTNEDPELNTYLNHYWDKEIPDYLPILTDDFAPVDQYTLKML